MVHALVVLIPGLFLAGPGQEGTTLLDQGYRQMYNLQFAQAHTTFQEWQRLYPADPMGPVSDAAAYLYSELHRLRILRSEFFVHDQHFSTDRELVPDPVWKRDFEASLAATRKLCSRTPDDRNAQLASILASGIRSNYLALMEKRYLAAIQEMKAARVKAERLLVADPTCFDAWLAVGVENYILSVKAAPVRWMLRLTGAGTNRALGIEKLRITAEKGHYLAPLARIMLVIAALRLRDTNQARELLAELRKDYPENLLYAAELAKLSRDVSPVAPR